MSDIIAIIVFLTVFVLTSNNIKSANKQNSIEHEKYCELVIMWESDADAGLEPNNRAGHPNYKGVSCAE